MIQKLTFPKAFSSFLESNKKTINIMFSIVSSFKKHIPDSYQYSDKHPPLLEHYKYTDKLYIGCILHIAKNSHSWNSFLGPIPGKQVHKRFREYINYGYFSELFNVSIKNYISLKDEIHLLSTDSTNIFNKSCIELHTRNPYFKNKKSCKVSTIVDSKGSPLSLSISDSDEHDSKQFEVVFNNMITNEDVKDKIKENTTLLGDKGYDSLKVRTTIRNSKIKPIISYNKRNCKNVAKIKKLTEEESKIYKSRIKVEHFFSIIKRYPKINNVYEKTINSYFNLVFLIAASININRSN